MLFAVRFVLQRHDYSQLSKLYPDDEEQVVKNILLSWQARAGATPILYGR